MADTIQINGVVYDYGDITCKVNGVRFYGIKSIKYGDKRERAKATGLTKDRRPLGVTKGKYTADDGAISIYKKSFQDLCDQLAIQSQNLLSYGDAIFPITFIYSDPRLGVIVDALRDCWIAAADGGGEDNADPLAIELGLGCSYILRNGKTLYSGRIA